MSTRIDARASLLVFFAELPDLPIGIGAHQAEAFRCCRIPRLDQVAVLAYGIGRALKPACTVGGLLSRQHLNKTAAEARGAVVGEADGAIEGLAIELCERVDLANLGIDAIANRDIDQAIMATQGDSGLGTGEGQRLEACTGAVAKDDGENTLYAQISRLRCR